MMATSGARGFHQPDPPAGRHARPDGFALRARSSSCPSAPTSARALSVLEFFLSSHGSRKSLADTALRTADSGYMTRRLVDVSQENIVREVDCFAGPWREGARPQGQRHPRWRRHHRVPQRPASAAVWLPRMSSTPNTGEVIVHVNEMIDHDIANRICAAGIKEVTVRSVLTCQSPSGVCARCYGANMTNGKLVDVGEAVGIIAAQSIGEPGTQLTMRTFHTGGVATGDDHHPGSSPRRRAVRGRASPSARRRWPRSAAPCTSRRMSRSAAS